MTITRRQAALLVLLTLLWGCNWPMMKLSLREVGPLWFRAITMTGGVLLLGAWVAARGVRLAPRASQWLPLAALALPNIVGWHLCSIIGLTLLPAGRAGILAFTMPVWTMLLGALMFRQRLSHGAWLASACALAAVALLGVQELTALAGRPASAVSSCTPSSATAASAQADASQAPCDRRWRNISAPSSMVHTGIVNARMPARPAGNNVRPMIEHRCQPTMLGRASAASGSHCEARGASRTPRAATHAPSSSTPPVIVIARNHSGPTSRSDSFIIGQLQPHSSVSRTSSAAWRRVMVIGRVRSTPRCPRRSARRPHRGTPAAIRPAARRTAALRTAAIGWRRTPPAPALRWPRPGPSSGRQ